MEVYVTEYSTFNYVSRVQSLFTEVHVFLDGREILSFDGIRRFTTLDYFPGRLNLIHNLKLLMLIWGVQTNAQLTQNL
jgi:hypothetical protein